MEWRPALSLPAHLPKVLIIHGADDRLIPIECGQHLYNNISSSELVVVDSASHLVHMAQALGRNSDPIISLKDNNKMNRTGNPYRSIHVIHCRVLHTGPYASGVGDLVRTGTCFPIGVSPRGHDSLAVSLWIDRPSQIRRNTRGVDVSKRNHDCLDGSDGAA
jgi:hypothetical protein